MEPTPFAEQLAEPMAQALAGHPRRDQPADVVRPGDLARAPSRRDDRHRRDLLPAQADEGACRASRRTCRSARCATRRSICRTRWRPATSDLAIGLLPQLKAGYFQRRLFKQHYVCMFRRGPSRSTSARSRWTNSLRPITWSWSSEGTGHGKADELLERREGRSQGRADRAALRRGRATSCTTPTWWRRFRSASRKRLAKPFGLSYVRHPAKLPEIAINLFWHARYNKDPANAWLRSLIVRLHGEGAPD